MPVNTTNPAHECPSGTRPTPPWVPYTQPFSRSGQTLAANTCAATTAAGLLRVLLACCCSVAGWDHNTTDLCLHPSTNPQMFAELRWPPVLLQTLLLLLLLLLVLRLLLLLLIHTVQCSQAICKHSTHYSSGFAVAAAAAGPAGAAAAALPVPASS
jgi:hypothetical protein